MISFSSRVGQLITDGKADAFIFLVIRNGDGSVFRASTTHHTSFAAFDGVEYIADDFIVSVDPPQQTTSVDRERYKFVITDSAFETAAHAENGLVGKRVTIYIGFFDPDAGKLLVDSPDDAFVMYRGRIDGLAGAFMTEDIGNMDFTVSCASPMMALDMSRGMYLSKDYVRAKDPTDASCDNIYKGSGDLLLKWGRI